MNLRILGKMVTHLLLKYLTKRARYQSSKNPAATEDNSDVKNPSAPAPEKCSQPPETLLIVKVNPSQGLKKMTSQEEVKEVLKAIVNSPHRLPPPLPPRRSQPLLAPPIPPRSRSCSPSSSLVSSIHEEVFSDSEIFRQVNPPAASSRIFFPDGCSPLASSLQNSHKEDPKAPPVQTTATMENVENKIHRRCEFLQAKLEDFSAQDVDEDCINLKDIINSEYKKKLEIIKDVLIEIKVDIGGLLREYSASMQPQKKEWWEAQKKNISDEVKAHERQVKAAVTRVKGNMTNQASNSLDSQESNESEIARGKKKKALSKMKVLEEAIENDAKDLHEKIYEVEDWKVEDDVTIGRGMKKAEKWDEEFGKIVQMMRELKTLQREYDVDESEVNCEEIARTVADLKDEVKEVKQKIVKEDNERQLYSLDTTKTSKITLPTFGGKDHEDFSKFKIDVEKGFKTNRISRDEQIIKLRECLKGGARKLIPDSNVTDINVAWTILEKMYGNPIKIIKQRKEALLRLGLMPKKVGNNFSVQITWYIDLTTFLRELIDLAIKNPKFSDMVFFNQFAIDIRQLFPNDRLRAKLRGCRGEGQAHLENMLELMMEWLDQAQVEQQENDVATKPMTSSSSRYSCSSCSNKSGGESGAHFTRTNPAISEDEDFGDEEKNFYDEKYPALIAFKPPRRHENCRVCQQLEMDGDTRDLYDNHVHSYPSGCPRYIQMTLKERFQLCKRAKICKRCHDPDYTFKPYDKNHDCPGHGSKGKYSCTKCDLHMWICDTHKEDNQEALEKFRDKYKTDFNLEFGLVVIGSVFGPISPTSEKAKFMKKPTTYHSKSTDANQENSRKSNDPLNSKSISTTEATRMLERKLSDSGEKIELRPIPAGRAQFMIGQTRGKTGPLNILYDSGCYALLLREGVQTELGASVLTTKGPFIVNGVGNTSVKVNDEWQTTLPLIDGSRQAVQGWTVDEVTAPLPRVDMTRAVDELKSDDKENSKLQSMFVDLVTGGQVDILLGLMYKAIFPRHVHSLPSGLTIYELQVASHNSQVNSVIGGPHESFEYIAQQVGGASLVFAHLMQRLELYKDFGPPSITKSVMSLNDKRFAIAHNEWDEELLDHEDLKEVLMDNEETSDEDDTSENDDQSKTKYGEKILNDEFENAESSHERPASQGMFSPDGCGPSVSPGIFFPDGNGSDAGAEPDSNRDPVKDLRYCENCMLSTDFDEENTKALKKLQHSQEGMQIEYRCPRCRECSNCKNSFETERVSLREESEDAMIHDSIKIDFENNEIVCSLPTRGEEHEFLSNNRDQALKILDQQCHKYNKDDETREVIVKAFDKLLRNKQMVLWTDLTEEEKKIIEAKPISHYIPWRVVFKPSLSTPARPVFDASMNTKIDEQGRGGRSLNDLVVKGKVTTLNLLKMINRFQVGAVAVQGDLKQFYASIKLVVNQWNLQRVLFRENLDPTNEVLEAVIKTLIWGVKSVSGQSEASVIQLAEFIKNSDPKLYDFLTNCRFCDDLGNSAAMINELKKLTKDADELLAQVGLKCKGWSFSGEEPLPELAEDGQVISIGGMKWHPQLDTLEVLIPRLHFSRKLRGRLIVGTKMFEGSMMEQLEEFVPKKLTRRTIFSKNYSIFDLTGKIAPIMSILKADMRAAVEQTEGWDDPVPDELRGKWLKNFWMLEKLRGMKFQRAIMPEGAVSSKMNLIIAVDAADQCVKMAGAWGRFRLKSGLFSCQLVLGRSLLAEKDSTIPKMELDALTIGSNMGWILKQSMGDWVESSILIGDSSIAMCWVTSTEKRLSLFHRNRCVQIRRGTDLNDLYHCATNFNPSDLGTRPQTVQLSDVGPNSPWEKGLPWMREEIDDAVEKGILVPAKNLRLDDKEEDAYKKGFIYEKTPEILTPGHAAMTTAEPVSGWYPTLRVEKVRERQEFSDYLIPPNHFKFEQLVRIYAMVRKFIRNIQSKPMQRKILDTSLRFQMFFTTGNDECGPSASSGIFFPDGCESNAGIIRENEKNCLALILKKSVIDDYSIFSNLNVGVKKPGIQFKGKHFVDLKDDDISWSLEYLFRKGSKEVLQFNTPKFVRKVAVEKSGILFAKSRILDSQRLQAAGGMEKFDTVAEYGIKLLTPVLDRYSPLSYSIGDYIHRKVAKHAGYENCFRESLNHCFIFQGLGLFRELGEDCVKCRKMRKKYLDIMEGPVSDESLVIAPPFYVSMCDLYGPCHIYVPGHAMKTRHRSVVEAKCYVLVTVCPVTKLVNLQVIEGKSADAIIDGVTRLSCEVGVPSLMLVDKESSILKALGDAEVDVRNLDMLLHKEKGIRFKTCPVSGHNYHGLVERKIRTVQECLDKSDVERLRLHATGLQTFCKLVENDMNNLPMGFSYGRDSDNSPLLKLIFPNMLRIGRNNHRALEGPIRLPKNPDDLMKKVEKAYSLFYELWNVTMIPKLMRMHKWFDGKAELKVGDIVYFRKVESELSSKWTVGKVSDIEKGRDGIVRRCTVQYQNASEEQPRYTDRAARSLVKLFHIDDLSWQQDMDLVEKLIAESKGPKVKDDVQSYDMNHLTGLRYRLKAVSGHNCPTRDIGVQHKAGARVAKMKQIQACKKCCCASHCLIASHGKEVTELDDNKVNAKQYLFNTLLDWSWTEFEEYKQQMFDDLPIKEDKLMSLLCAVNTDLTEVGASCCEGPVCLG